MCLEVLVRPVLVITRLSAPTSVWAPTLTTMRLARAERGCSLTPSNLTKFDSHPRDDPLRCGLIVSRSVNSLTSHAMAERTRQRSGMGRILEAFLNQATRRSVSLSLYMHAVLLWCHVENAACVLQRWPLSSEKKGKSDTRGHHMQCLQWPEASFARAGPVRTETLFFASDAHVEATHSVF